MKYKLVRVKKGMFEILPVDNNLSGQVESALRLIIKRKDLKEFLGTGSLAFSINDKKFFLQVEKIIVSSMTSDTIVAAQMISNLYLTDEEGVNIKISSYPIKAKALILAAFMTLRKAYEDAQDIVIETVTKENLKKVL